MADAMLMQKALAEIRDLRAKLAASEQASRAPIAIVGIGCRFPGGADSPDAFWKLLQNGVDAIGRVPEDRWDVDAYYDPDPAAPGKMHLREGGFLDDVDAFDAQFFGISPREAAWMDPQQRLLLEVCWDALEHSGHAPDSLGGKQTGVFMGLSSFNYATHILSSFDTAEVEPFFGTGNALSVAAGRLSYTLGLQGPAYVIDTACSSSLAAVHLACESLRRGECSMALAGGAGLILTPDTTVQFCKAGMLARDGRCKTFDSAADGYVRSEGAGVVVLKRLADAIASGDSIIAVIRGSACNHDGRSTGLTVPNGPAQQAVIRAALDNAGVRPGAVAYIEAHGTGTSLGDPIELGALGAVFRAERTVSEPLWVGSVKTNLGHLEAAAGIAGIIKVALAMQHGCIPAHLHFKQPTPHFDWDANPLRITARAVPWPEGASCAGVSSFGFSGTNAHVVMERAPRRPEPASTEDRPLHIYTLSARSETALDELVARHRSALSAPEFASRCYTANAGRAHFAHRLAAVAADADGLREAFLKGQVVRAYSEYEPRIAFLFTGQGAQYAGMGHQLYLTHPIFRQTLDACDELLRAEFHAPLLEALYGPEHARLNETEFTQPALFALEYALAQLWRSWGVEPSIVLGHSLGEYTAACVAGVFDWRHGLRLAALRGRLMGSLPRDGEMAAVLAPFEEVEPFVRQYDRDVSFGSINGPRNVVISGRRAAVQALTAKLHEAGKVTRPLQVSHAFHSPCMDSILAEFEAAVAALEMNEPALTLISNLTGKAMSAGTVPSAQYWSGHIRQPVLFAEGLRTLQSEGADVVLEIGPGTTLLGMARQVLDGDKHTFLPSLRPGTPDWQTILQSLAQLYVRGAKIDWKSFDAPYARRTLHLPTYPFERQRYWVNDGSRARRKAIEDAVYAIHWQPCETRFSRSQEQILVFEADEAMRAEDACASLIEQVRAISAEPSPRRLWVMTRGAANAPAQAALRGLAKTIAIEHPDIYGGMIDLDPSLPATDQRHAAGLAPDAGDDLMLRNGSWYTPRLRKISSSRAKTVQIRDDATYLISGGLGSLGLQFAVKLAEMGARHLLLLGRSPGRPDAHTTVARLRESGVFVSIEQTDVACQETMRAVLDRITAPLRGVVHAAGVLESNLILSTSHRQLAQALRPKAQGAWTLHELTADKELDFFVLCSSAASILGAGGQGAYAAANASLDALAHYRRSLGLPAVSINWGPWAGTGMASQRREASGIRPLDPQFALDVFARNLNPAVAQLLVLHADWPALAENYSGRVPHILLDLLPAAKQTPSQPIVERLAGLSPAQRRDVLTHLVQQKAASVMGFSHDNLPPQKQGFFDMGMDSLLSVELRNKLQAEWPVPLPATLTFEYPSAEALAEFLDRTLPTPESAAVPTAGLWDEGILEELELLEGVLRRH